MNINEIIFTEQPDDDALLYRRTYQINELTTIEIGIYPMLYGYRVRVGLSGDMFYFVDYCCGDQLFWINTIYSLVLHKLKVMISKMLNQFPNFGFLHHEVADYLKKGFPMAQIKPIYKDDNCLDNLKKDASIDMEIISIGPDLHQRKMDYISKMF